jgi:flagellar basal-body rod protein FlgF
MDKMLYIAMSGAKQNMHALSVNANNLANAKTVGFKSDLAQARSMQAFGEGMPTRVFSMTERASQNFDGGARMETGRSLDVAIDGDGWIAVESNTPEPALGAQLGTTELYGISQTKEAYTRFGQLEISPEGVLQTSTGHPVVGDAGPIFIPLPIANISIGKDGAILVRPQGAPANALEEVGRIKMVNPDNRLLEKGNDGLFRRKDGQVEQADINVTIATGMLETSNVNPVGEMTDMIALQRQFEMQMKLMKTAEEIDSASSSLLRAF